MIKEAVDYQAVNYLKDPLTSATLKQLLSKAGLKPHDAIRTKEDAYREHVAGRNLTDDQLIEVMADHPELIQRPIVVRGDKAVIARPVEALANLGIGRKRRS